MSKTEVKVNQGGGYVSLIIAILLLIAGVFLYGKWQDAKEKSKALSNNIYALNDSVNSYRIRIDRETKLWASKAKAISLERDDYRKLYLKECRLAQKISQGQPTAVANVGVVVRDSIREIPVIVDRTKHTLTIPYTSKWLDFNMVVQDEKVAGLDYETRDSIMIVEGRKALFWGLIPYGQRELSAASKNPKSKVFIYDYKRVFK